MKYDIFDYYEEHKAAVWLMVIVVPVATLTIGSILAREIFWDSFLWRYFWGPVVADSKGRSVNGISSGYNIVNTATYGLILIVSFFGILELIEHFKVKINKLFVYSLLPWVILGGSLRSLEDAALFADPLDKFMISPMIYLLLGFSAIFLMLLGAYLSKIEWKSKRSNVVRLLILAPLPIGYLILQNYLEPFFMSFLILILISLSISYLVGLRYLEFNEKYLFFTYGTTLVSLSLAFNIYFIFFKENTNSFEAPIILGSAVVMTLLLLGLFWLIERVSFTSGEYFGLLKNPLNVILILAHLFDASSTYRGITAHGYAEKHVLPDFLIGLTGPYIVFVVKILLVLAAIYVLDVMLDEDFTEQDSLRVFLKFVIIVLGAAPAVRNTLRLTMGM